MMFQNLPKGLDTPYQYKKCLEFECNDPSAIIVLWYIITFIQFYLLGKLFS